MYSPCPAGLDPASHPVRGVETQRVALAWLLMDRFDWQSQKEQGYKKTKPNSLTNQRLLGINVANV